MIKGRIRVNFLKEGGITVTMSISEEDAAQIDHELMNLRKGEVALVAVDEAVLSGHDEIHEARKSLGTIAGSIEGIRDALRVAEAKLPLSGGSEAQDGDLKPADLESDGGPDGGTSEF